MSGLCIPPPRKVGGLSPPASAAYGVDCELSLVCSKNFETNFKNDEDSAPYRWVINTASVRGTETTSGNQPTHDAESRNPPSTALLGVDIISPLCWQLRNDLFLNWYSNQSKKWESWPWWYFKELRFAPHPINLTYPILQTASEWNNGFDRSVNTKKLFMRNDRYTVRMKEGDGLTQHKMHLCC